MHRIFPWVLLLFVANTHAASPCNGEGTTLQILGSGDASLGTQRAGNGALVWVDGKARILINTGSDIALRFQESGAQWNDLDAIVFTHMDVAHANDLAALLHAAQAGGRTRALPVYGPPGNKLAPSTVTLVRDLFDPVRGVYRHLGSLLAPLDRSGYKLEPHDVREPPTKLAAPRRPGPRLLPVFSNERIQLLAMSHATETVPVLSWHIVAGAVRLAVDGGARHTPDSAKMLMEGASLLMTPGFSGDEALRAASAQHWLKRDRQTVLTGRNARSATREEETLSTARKYAAGPVVWADDLACYRL